MAFLRRKQRVTDTLQDVLKNKRIMDVFVTYLQRKTTRKMRITGFLKT